MASKLTILLSKIPGNVSADVDIKLIVKDMFGNVVYENGGQYAAIAEETRQLQYSSQLQPFWGGKYRAEISISYNKKAGEWGVSQDPNDLIIKTAEPIERFFLANAHCLGDYRMWFAGSCLCALANCSAD